MNLNPLHQNHNDSHNIALPIFFFLLMMLPTICQVMMPLNSLLIDDTLSHCRMRDNMLNHEIRK